MSIAARASEFSGESGGVRRLHLAIRMPECVNPVCAATNISEQYCQSPGIERSASVATAPWAGLWPARHDVASHVR